MAMAAGSAALTARSPGDVKEGVSAVVVSSSADYHRERPDLIILAVTSQARPSANLGEATIAKWKEAGLLRPSVLKPVLTTIERGLVLRKLGQLEPEDRTTFRKVLDEILGS